MHYLQMIKQKVCLLLENLDPLTNLKNGLVFCWYFWLIFIPVNWFLKPDFNCSTSFVLPWVNSYNWNIKFVSVIENLAPWSVIAVANLDQFVIKINFTISNGTIILPCFVPFLSVWPVIFALRLNNLVALALLKSVTTLLASRAHSSLQYCQKKFQMLLNNYHYILLNYKLALLPWASSTCVLFIALMGLIKDP